VVSNKIPVESNFIHSLASICICTIGPQNLDLLEVFMVNNWVFRRPKHLFFMVLGAHGMYIQYI